MKKLLAFVACAMSTAAFADLPANQWLDRLEDRGAQIEVIRVASKKSLIETSETDPEVDSILKEAEDLENEASAEQDEQE